MKSSLIYEIYKILDKIFISYIINSNYESDMHCFFKLVKKFI